MKATINNVQFDMGNGRYSAFACEVARDTFRLFAYPPEICAAVAMSAASDLGRLQGHASVSISKANKDGKVTVREIGKIKGVTLTHSLALVRALSLLNDLEYVENVQAQLCDSLTDWIKELKPASPIVEQKQEDKKEEKKEEKQEEKKENVPQNS